MQIEGSQVFRSGRSRRVLDGHPSFEPAPLPAFTLRSGLLRAAGAELLRL